MPANGAVAQETLDPLAVLTEAGIKVTVATPKGQKARLEPVGKAMAILECFWRPTLRLLRNSPAKHLLDQAVAIEGIVDEQIFDAVLLPGGHGCEYANFVRDPKVHRLVDKFFGSGKIVALQCHSVVLGVWAKSAITGKSLIHNKHVTCWPSIYERFLGSLPILGKYFMPFGKPVQKMVAPDVLKVHFDYPWSRNPHVVVDGNLVTSWGPWSAECLGHVLTGLLQDKSRLY